MASQERRFPEQGRQRAGGQNGGIGGSLGAIGERAREAAGETTQRLRERFEDAGDEMVRRYHEAEGVLAHYPASSVLVGFGLGFGLGLVISSLLMQREDERWTWGQAPDRLRRLPESLHDTLDRLAETVRRLPEAICEHMPSMPGRR